MFTLVIIVLLAASLWWLANEPRRDTAAVIWTGMVCLILAGPTVPARGDAPADERSAGADGSILGEVSSDAELSETIANDDGTTSISSRSAPRELAVEPQPTFRYLTTPRPDWVETAAVKGDEGYQIAVESGLHLRKRTAQQALRDEVQAAVDAYVNDYLESELASTLSGYAIEERENGVTRTISLHLDGKTFEIARQRFDEQIEFDYGVMNQAHALVKIDRDVNTALDQHWARVRATSRLFQAGLGMTAILLLLGTMFGYLKLDTATRGYYTGRLQFGAAAAILAIIAAVVVCANWIPWM